MDTVTASAAFAALAQPTRLEAFRLLAQAGSDGIRAGAIAERLGVVASTLSHHLSQLEQAGLVRSRRQGRMIIYVCELERSRTLSAYLAGVCGVDRGDRRPVLAARTTVAGG